MGCLLTYWTGEAGFGNRSGTSEELIFDDKAEGRLEGAMVWLLHYAAENWTLLSLAVPISSTSAKKPKCCGAKAVEAPKSNRPESWVCLLCNKCKPFTRHHCLSRHNKTAHINQGAFDQSFLCLHCTPPVKISSTIGWCDHVKQTHGKMYAPVVSSKLLAETQVHQMKKTPTRSTKWKREDEILGMVVLNLSEKPQKRACTNNEEVSSMLLETLEGNDNSDYGECYGLFLCWPWLRHNNYRNFTARFTIVFGLCLWRHAHPSWVARRQRKRWPRLGSLWWWQWWRLWEGGDAWRRIRGHCWHWVVFPRKNPLRDMFCDFQRVFPTETQKVFLKEKSEKHIMCFFQVSHR